MTTSNKFSLYFLVACIFLLSWENQALAAETYTDQGTVFFTPMPTGYVSQGVAFYAYSTQTTGTTPVYRFYNSTNGDHFYTGTQSEIDEISNNPKSGYIPQGIAFYAHTTQTTGTTPVYRFYSTINGDHFYTASQAEANAINNNPGWGYVSQGIMLYASPTQDADTNPIYRFYSATNGDHFYTASQDEVDGIDIKPVFRFYSKINGDHFYTASQAEADSLYSNQGWGYLYEGIVFYAHSKQTSGTTPVYRFYSRLNGDHFYTKTQSEIDEINNNPSSGYVSQGIAFYAYSTQTTGTTPVYRLYNTTTGDHFYTVSKSEQYRLLVPPLGPEIAVGLWNYSKTQIIDAPFQISAFDAKKAYNVKDSGGNILAQANGGTTTSISYDDNQNQLTVTVGALSKVLAGTSVSFDAADGNNSDMIFNTNRSSFTSDWRGTINNYRGKIKVQYYRGADIINNSSTVVTQIWINNLLPLEQYVWGSAETSGIKDMDHTQVMTTIVRTYGFWYIKYANKYSALGFKIRSDSGSQNYGGYDWEKNHPNIKIAAQNTRGVIATYGGDVALTPYSSASDGRTRSWQEKWGSTDYPWCQSVPDPYGKDLSRSSGSHMVGLIGYGSENLAGSYGWDWQRILHYYYTGIGLTTNY